MEKLKLKDCKAVKRWLAYLRRAGIKEPAELPENVPVMVSYTVDYEGRLNYSYTYKQDFDETENNK